MRRLLTAGITLFILLVVVSLVGQLLPGEQWSAIRIALLAAVAFGCYHFFRLLRKWQFRDRERVMSYVEPRLFGNNVRRQRQAIALLCLLFGDRVGGMPRQKAQYQMVLQWWQVWYRASIGNVHWDDDLVTYVEKNLPRPV